MEPEEVLLGARARAARHPAHPPARRRHDPRRGGRRRRLARLRQHAVPAGLPTRSSPIGSGRTSPTGRQSSTPTTTRPRACSASRRTRSVTPADEILQKVAADLGVSDTFHLTPVGVYFGDGAGVEAPDPYFGGAGPARRGCLECGECMTGCRHNAKNTLVKNYLHLAGERGQSCTRSRRSRASSHGRAGVTHGHHAAPARAAAPSAVHRRPGRHRRGRVGHPAAAAPHEGRGASAGHHPTGWAS